MLGPALSLNQPKKYTQVVTEKGETPCGAALEVPTSFAYTCVFPQKQTAIIQHDEEIK